MIKKVLKKIKKKRSSNNLEQILETSQMKLKIYKFIFQTHKNSRELLKKKAFKEIVDISL